MLVTCSLFVFFRFRPSTAPTMARGVPAVLPRILNVMMSTDDIDTNKHNIHSHNDIYIYIYIHIYIQIDR